MIKVGIIGFGVVGQRRKKYIVKNRSYELLCISDISFIKDFKIKKINFYQDYRKFTDHNLDAVFITLPNYLIVRLIIFLYSQPF